MTFNPNIPAGSQTISSTTLPIQTNFSTSNTNFGVDHVDFTNTPPPGGNGGRHNTVTLVQQAADPTAVSTSPILYCKSTTSNTVNNDIYFRRASNDSSSIVQLTTTKVNPTASVSGYSFLPGGIIVQWGTNAAATDGGTTNFPIAFPNNCFNVQVTQNTASTLVTIGINGFTTTNFTFRKTSGGGIPITFFAIGN